MGKLPLEIREVDPGAVIEAALETVRPMAEEKSVQWTIELNPTNGTVSADLVRLQQVFWNLLTNAFKFSEKGSKIGVHLTQVEVNSKECVQAKVIDQGKGIPQHFLPHIFERFSQGDRTSARFHGGLGLGLAIVRNLVELHGGTVQAESQGEGKGATFTVILPFKIGTTRKEAQSAMSSKEPLRRTTGESNDHPRLDGLRLLIVDDEVNTREAFSVLLKLFGADVSVASSVAEALEIFPKYKPHVLVSDIAMPGEDGYSLMRKIRALGQKQGGDIPALAITAYAGRAEIDRAHAADFQEHLAKPVGSIDLARTIAGLAARGAIQ